MTPLADLGLREFCAELAHRAPGARLTLAVLGRDYAAALVYPGRELARGYGHTLIEALESLCYQAGVRP